MDDTWGDGFFAFTRTLGKQRREVSVHHGTKRILERKKMPAEMPSRALPQGVGGGAVGLGGGEGEGQGGARAEGGGVGLAQGDGPAGGHGHRFIW